MTVKKQKNKRTLIKNDINIASDAQQCSNIYRNATTTHANKNTPTKLILQHNPTAKSTSGTLPHTNRHTYKNSPPHTKHQGTQTAGNHILWTSPAT
jgi:hypothetical protein